MPALRDTVTYINGQTFRRDIKVMVGCALITQAFTDEIGADACLRSPKGEGACRVIYFYRRPIV